MSISNTLANGFHIHSEAQPEYAGKADSVSVVFQQMAFMSRELAYSVHLIAQEQDVAYPTVNIQV